MTLLPPDLGFDRDKYYRDLEYRNECDQEIAAERHERMQLLFNPCLISSDAY